MSDKENNEKPGSSNNHESLPVVEEKKFKKNIRFQIPSDIQSEESFTSALSYNLVDENEEIEEDDEDILWSRKSSSVLKKYVLSPLHHSQPRSVSNKPCFSHVLMDDKNIFELTTSSSNQLFEVIKHSPTSSDVDLNLIQSTYLRKLAAVKEAISNGANVNTCRDKQTPLLIATEIGDTRLVSYLLTVPHINPDFQNHFGQTSLIVAVRNAFDRIVRLLLSHNADVNLADNMGRSPLHVALFLERAGLAKLLLAYGADNAAYLYTLTNPKTIYIFKYEKQDCFHERPMYTAAVKKPNLECLLTLLKIGATPEYFNVTGISLLSRVILNGKNNLIAEMLVHYGADVNSQDLISKKTPLHYAALTNNVELTKFLVNKGADINVKTTYNFNPYEEAIFHGSEDVINFYADKTISANLKTFASIKVQTHFGKGTILLGTKNSEKKKKKKKSKIVNKTKTKKINK